MKKKLYFGHPINTYDTDLENKMLQKISKSFPDWKIENSNQKKHNEGYNHWKKTTGRGMDYFTKIIIPNCRGGIFLTFRDGRWGAGVFREAQFLLSKNYPIWMININLEITRIENLSTIKPLTIKETRSRTKTTSGQKIPY